MNYNNKTAKTIISQFSRSISFKPSRHISSSRFFLCYFGVIVDQEPMWDYLKNIWLSSL